VGVRVLPAEFPDAKGDEPAHSFAYSRSAGVCVPRLRLPDIDAERAGAACGELELRGEDRWGDEEHWEDVAFSACGF